MRPGCQLNHQPLLTLQYIRKDKTALAHFYAQGIKNTDETIRSKLQNNWHEMKKEKQVRQIK